MARKLPEKDSLSPNPSSNHVTLFSNGIGHFRRVYKIAAGKQEKISIPFKRDHVSDVLSSLSVFGNVKYDSPPSFTPTNSNATALTINPSNTMLGLLRDARGANVTVNMVNGRGDRQVAILGGTESHEVTNSSGNTTTVDYVVLMSGGSVSKIALSEVASIHFTDESVRSEIDKALKNAFQKIKPDSTFLDLALSGLSDREETAIVQYTVPVAAWKMRYNIRQDDNSCLLEGTAIIDNNTDEDWNDFLVSVVTGNPISFSTDLAEIKVPERVRINLVDTNAQGMVEAAESLAQYACGSANLAGFEKGGSARGMSMAKGGVARRAFSSSANCASFGLESAQLESMDYEMDDAPAAMAPGVDTKEIGDFCVFTSKSAISISSKRSAVVPMFTVPLTKAGAVLLYKESDHSRRPWRAVKFKNEADFSLGKGKVVIYQDGVFSGECVLETTTPGENRTLPHCLENHVKIIPEVLPQETKASSMKLSEGMVYQETVFTAVKTYSIENKKDEEYKVLVEHVNQLAGGVATYAGVKIEEVEKIKNGNRLYFVLPAHGKMTLTVTETWVRDNHFSLGGNFNWINQNIIWTKHPLSMNKDIKAAAEVQKKLDYVNQAINEAGSRKNELTEQAGRVRSNLQATKDEAATQIRTQWVTDLDESEKEIRNIDKNIVPSLLKQRTELQERVADELKKISAGWKETQPANVK